MDGLLEPTGDVRPKDVPERGGGGGVGGAPPPLDGCGPPRTKAGGSLFRWGLRTGFRAQQNTSSPSRGPLERANGAFGRHEALELDGVPDEEPMDP